MSDTDLDPDDDLDRVLVAARPAATATAEVRDRHRAELRAAVERARSRGLVPAWRRRPVQVAAAVVAVAALGTTLVVLRPDGERTDVTAGPGETTPVDGGVSLTSAACEGHALPFAVPVGDGYGAPVLGAAPGAPAPEVDGQLVAHWTSADTAVEVRWPAVVSPTVLAELGRTEAEVVGQMADGVSLASYIDADLVADIVEARDGTVDGSSSSFRTDPDLDGTYALGIARYERVPETTPGRGDGLHPTWGSGTCSTVVLTVRALDGRADVRDEAEPLYRALVAEGGPLVPAREHPALVVARADATTLEPPTECNLPPGVDQDPIRAEPVDGPGPFPTADEALEAFLATQVSTNPEGPFGPETWPTAPRGGYTALTLPDGRVAYRWPAQGPTEVVGYYFAEQGPDGWSITRTEGPSC